MTKVSETEFLNKLFEVVYKLSKIVKTQSPRFKKKWDEYLKPFDEKPHIVRQIPLDKTKFLKDIDYRIDVLKNVEQATVDGFYSTKTLLHTLYSSYFDSELFKKDFSEEDQLILKYFIAKEILGNLIQYNKLDHESVPLKYNIIGRNYTLIKLQGLSDLEILYSLKKLNMKGIELADVNNLMKEIEAEGIVIVEKKGKTNYYYLNKEIALTKDGKLVYTQLLQSLVDWPTLFFRSFFNIRELNVTLDQNIKYHDFLQKILLKTATQGFSPTNFVFKNLVKYYEKIKEEPN
ncbi:MAG: hypothetical protein CEE43_05610 [Promethearchaeota archaeon Loki_b32]|nr:MAG: hypothetical protein CEE43_05610 [Candidatus Lokiarchaeota archaeon Loki_b32]